MDEVALRDVLSCMSVGVAVIGADGRILYFNPAAEKLVGVGPIDEGPDAWPRIYGLYKPDEVTPFPAAELPAVRALQGEATDDVAMFVDNAVVSKRHLCVSGRPWNGRGAIVVFHDVAARRRDEAELRKHRLFLESIVEEVPLMIFVKEARELRFERFNRAGETLLGIKRAASAGCIRERSPSSTKAVDRNTRTRRINSSPSSRTSCETRSRRSATASTCSSASRRTASTRSAHAP